MKMKHPQRKLIILTLLMLSLVCVQCRKTEPMQHWSENTVDASTLVAAYMDEKPLSTIDYLDKKMIINGTIKEINYRNNRCTIILDSNYKGRYVICDMKPKEKEGISQLQTGQHISLQGICRGALLDVIMQDCTLLNQ